MTKNNFSAGSLPKSCEAQVLADFPIYTIKYIFLQCNILVIFDYRILKKF